MGWGGPDERDYRGLMKMRRPRFDRERRFVFSTKTGGFKAKINLKINPSPFSLEKIMPTLLVCDVEGTIFKAKYQIKGTEYASTMWQPIAQRLGEAAEIAEKETHEKWENGHYTNYKEWVEDTIRIHKKFGLKKNDFYKLIDEAEYIDGVVEFFQNLDRSEYIPVLVSGGFQELIRRAQKELKIKYGFGACEYIFDDEDGFLSHYSLRACDFEGKYEYIKMLFGEYNLNSKVDWVFVGDGKNDVEIAKKAPFRIGINPHDDLKPFVDHHVNCFAEVRNILASWVKPKLAKENVKSGETKNKDNASVDESAEEKLRKENLDLKEQVKKLNRKVKELRDKAYKKEKITNNMVFVDKDDYTRDPTISLRSLLNECKIVFFGSRKDRRNFQYFEKFHENLRVVSGIDSKFDLTPMMTADFVFTFNSCMKHCSSWRSEEAKQIKPYANLKHDNIDMLERAMANVLYRYIFESD